MSLYDYMEVELVSVEADGTATLAFHSFEDVAAGERITETTTLTLLPEWLAYKIMFWRLARQARKHRKQLRRDRA